MHGDTCNWVIQFIVDRIMYAEVTVTPDGSDEAVDTISKEIISTRNWSNADSRVILRLKCTTHDRSGANVSLTVHQLREDATDARTLATAMLILLLTKEQQRRQAQLEAMLRNLRSN